MTALRLSLWSGKFKDYVTSMAEKDQFMIFVMHEDEERDTSLCSMNMRLPFCNQVNWTAFLRREVEGRECKQSSAGAIQKYKNTKK